MPRGTDGTLTGFMYTTWHRWDFDRVYVRHVAQMGLWQGLCTPRGTDGTLTGFMYATWHRWDFDRVYVHHVAQIQSIVRQTHSTCSFTIQKNVPASM